MIRFSSLKTFGDRTTYCTKRQKNFDLFFIAQRDKKFLTFSSPFSTGVLPVVVRCRRWLRPASIFCLQTQKCPIMRLNIWVMEISRSGERERGVARMFYMSPWKVGRMYFVRFGGERVGGWSARFSHKHCGLWLNKNNSIGVWRKKWPQLDIWHVLSNYLKKMGLEHRNYST